MMVFFLSCTFWETSTFAKKKGNEDVCTHYQRFLDAGVPKEPLNQALAFYTQKQFSNNRYVSIADYTQSSTKNRFYLLDLETGHVQKEKVSHGSGFQKGKKYGDPDHDGMLDSCQHNGDRTNMTRVGFFTTAELYFSSAHDAKKGRKGWPDIQDSATRYNGLRLKGMSSSNKESYSRGVVMHEANYNKRAKMGRSYGCPAFVPKKGREIMHKIKEGSLFYGYAPQCVALMKAPIQQVKGWESQCSSH